MIHIDGSQGEGGGQILRTALSLSLVTGRPVKLENIRARRPKPGLMRQHLACVRAAVAIGKARAEGAELGSRELTLYPGPVQAGNYAFDVGSAGSTMLVLQTILPPLWLANGDSEITLAGGTHNPFAPPFPFLERSFLPLMKHLGFEAMPTLERAGFHPAGGGRVSIRVRGGSQPRPLRLGRRGTVTARRGRAVVQGLAMDVAVREVAVFRNRFGIEDSRPEPLPSGIGAGNLAWIEVETADVTSTFVAFGERGVSSEAVAQRAGAAMERFLSGSAVVEEHLADQLLLPLALAGGGEFTTTTPTQHTRTNAAVVERFLDRTVRLEPTSAATESTSELWTISL